jgi:two-component system, OmpR family, sensor kinase
VSIRWRLAGTSALLTFVILCAFAVAVGTLTERKIRSDFNHQISAFASTLQNQLGRIQITPGHTIARPSLTGIPTPEHSVIRIVTADGLPLASTPHAPDLGQPFRTYPYSQTSEYNGYRVETRQELLTNGGVVYLQYARPLSDVQDTINRVRLFLFFGVLGGTVLALLAGLMIARRAMAPIAALTATAREIERTRDPRLELPEPAADDEVAELARTLQAMLRALSQARAESEAMLERQRAFVADASHELRTPLTSVLANLELLADSLQGEEGDAARAALRSSRRMRRLVADLLLLARADVGRTEVHRPLDLAEVLIDAAAELEPVSGEHSLVVDAQPAPMEGVYDDLHRLVLNLLENALRHTPQGTEIRAASRVLADGSVELTVEDDGPGIPAELAPRLFDRFVRGAGDRGGSFGLGLAIVQAVTQAHGGTVSVSASRSGGARFVVRLRAGGEAAERERAEHAAVS